jgi:hypothetical protein
MKLAALLFATTAWGAQHHHRDTTDNGIDLGAISSALYLILSLDYLLNHTNNFTVGI